LASLVVGIWPNCAAFIGSTISVCGTLVIHWLVGFSVDEISSNVIIISDPPSGLVVVDLWNLKVVDLIPGASSVKGDDSFDVGKEL
jgi:hypothetical protein